VIKVKKERFEIFAFVAVNAKGQLPTKVLNDRWLAKRKGEKRTVQRFQRSQVTKKP